MSSLSKLVSLLGLPEFLEISSSSYCSFGVKQQSLTSLLIYQTLFLVVFEYFYGVYLFEINSLAIRRTMKNEVRKWSALTVIFSLH